ncbi:MAG: TonB-dependent receptor plug domain-containing protein [Lacunisphaera sp.]
MTHTPVNVFPPRLRYLLTASLCLISLLSSRAADSASDPSPAVKVPVVTTDKPEKTDLITLSPFRVDTSQQNGYFAPNTLSGTRLNSKVQDLGASITVITKQQLDDTAAVDINDIFKYESNTEGISNYTPINTVSGATDVIQGGTSSSGGPAVATRVRGISAPNITYDYFTHTARIPIDTYNIDSVEITRGSNSTVAGLGSPSGTINTNTTPANLTRSSGKVQFRVDDNGGFRSSLNFNTVLWQDKLALRVAALDAETEFKQKPSYDRTKRVFGALAFSPFKDTLFTAKAEYYREDRQAPNSLTPKDGVTEWINAGRPTWNPLTYTATVNGAQTVLPATADNTGFPAGLYVNTNTYTRPTMYFDNGQVQLWEINRKSTAGSNPNNSVGGNPRMISSGSAYMRGTVNGNILYTVPGISDQSLYDWTSVNSVPTNWNYDKAAIYTAEFSQKIIENLYFRAAWHLEDSTEFNRNITNPPTLQVDVNQYLLDGRANPYYLRPYISTIEPSIYRLPEYNDAQQAALTYSFDLSKRAGWTGWLGQHQFGANYEWHKVTAGTFRYREAVIDPNHAWLTPGALNYTNGAAIGRPNYIYYVGPSGATGYTAGYTPPLSGVSGNYHLNYYNAATAQWVSDPATFGTSPYVTSQTQQETHTRSLTYQGHLLKDYLVVTGGLRKDDYRTRNSATGALIDGNSGLYTYDALKNWGAWNNASGPTNMISLVAYPLHNDVVGLTYSRASSFLPQPLAVDLLGTALPNTYGHSRDFGFFVNLLKDKLVLSVKSYKTDVSNDRTSNTTIGTRVARLDAGMLLPSTSSDTFSLYNFAQTVAQQRLGAGASPAQLNTEAAKITQYSGGFQSAVAANTAGAAIRGTADTAAKGDELELSYNPSYNWNIKFAGAKTEAINKTIENGLEDYIAQRMPYWLSVKDDQGNLWWTSTALSTQSAKAFYDSAVAPVLKIDQALLGKSNPQIKKYTARLLSTYRFTQGRLNNFSVGSSARWDDKSVIGYMGAAPDADGIVRSLDVNKPAYDPARYTFDFWVSYKIKLFRNKVRANFQLNVNDAFQNGGLRTVAINPDGTPSAFRIINPRQFLLTTTFEF